MNNLEPPPEETGKAESRMKAPKDYSQSGETESIFALLPKDDGFFVEVGAHDGKSISNTFGLVEIGWHGIAIEPHPVIFERLRQNMNGWPVKIIQAAATKQRQVVRLYLGKDDPDTVLSTICEDDSEWFRAVRSENFVEVDGVPLTEILIEQNCPPSFDLLSIDAEGMDLDILQALDFTRFSPTVIITENYEPKNAEKFALLVSQGYEQRPCAGGTNTIWMRR